MTAKQLPDFDELLAELGRLESQEQRISTARRKLHNLIDSGFVNDVTRRRDRQLSEERLALHRRIDVLRGLLTPADRSVKGAAAVDEEGLARHEVRPRPE